MINTVSGSATSPSGEILGGIFWQRKNSAARTATSTFKLSPAELGADLSILNFNVLQEIKVWSWTDGKKHQNVIRLTFPERNFSISYLVVWSFVRILLYYFNQRAKTLDFKTVSFCSFKIPKLCSQVLHHRMNLNSHINRPMYGYKHCYITIKYCLILIQLSFISWFNVLYICPS